MEKNTMMVRLLTDLATLHDRVWVLDGEKMLRAAEFDKTTRVPCPLLVMREVFGEKWWFLKEFRENTVKAREAMMEIIMSADNKREHKAFSSEVRAALLFAVGIPAKG